MNLGYLRLFFGYPRLFLGLSGTYSIFRELLGYLRLYFLSYPRFFLFYPAPTAFLANYSVLCVRVFGVSVSFLCVIWYLLRFLANNWYICVFFVFYLRLFPVKVWILTPESNRKSKNQQ